MFTPFDFISISVFDHIYLILCFYLFILELESFFSIISTSFIAMCGIIYALRFLSILSSVLNSPVPLDLLCVSPLIASVALFILFILQQCRRRWILFVPSFLSSSLSFSLSLSATTLSSKAFYLVFLLLASPIHGGR